MKDEVQLTLRFADVKETRPRWRFNAAYGVTDRILVGLEYNPAVAEVIPTLNWVVAPEDRHGARPMVTLGTSSDRIFSPEGTRSYFATVSKSLPGARLAPYVSVNWSEWEDVLTFPFGLNCALRPDLSAMFQNDGRNSHWLLTYKAGGYNVSLLLLKGRHFGVSWGLRL